ncbi:MAG: hypothetical protein IT168_19335 [Bryobacterales bacterium]|nr:hypothetical protein [Bryobacterales bacterium]
MRTLGLFCVSALCFAQPQSHPAAWRYIHPQAKTLIGVDVRAAIQSPLGQKLKTEFLNAGFRKTLSTPGVDLLENVEKLLFSSPVLPNTPSAGKADSQPVVISVSGRFDLAKIRTFMRDKKAKESTYKGIPVFSRVEKGTDIQLALVNAQIVVLGDERSLHAALDLQAAGGAPLAGKPLFQRATELATLYEIWVASEAMPPDATISQMPGGNLLSGVLGLEGGISLREGVDLQLNLLTESPAKAKEIAEAARVLLQFAAMGPNSDKRVQDVLRKLRLDSDGERVSVAIGWPLTEIDQQIAALKGQVLQAALRRTPAPTPAAADPVPPPTPAKPEPMVVKIYGLSEGTREVTIESR